jgi:K+-transporting ATPase ATPase C chain
MKSLVASIRLVIVTMLICVTGYTALIFGFAHIVTPNTAEGSLIKDKDGKIIGSHLIAQSFTNAIYFWPRPSAVGYNAAGAGGSNKSPTSTNLTERAQQLIEQYGASVEKPLPANLAAASGGGLDPHITEHAALYQAERVAQARNLPQSQVEGLVKQHAFAAGGFLTPVRLVNVLELNLALDLLAAKP